MEVKAVDYFIGLKTTWYSECMCIHKMLRMEFFVSWIGTSNGIIVPVNVVVVVVCIERDKRVLLLRSYWCNDYCKLMMNKGADREGGVGCWKERNREREWIQWEYLVRQAANGEEALHHTCRYIKWKNKMEIGWCSLIELLNKYASRERERERERVRA